MLVWLNDDFGRSFMLHCQALAWLMEDFFFCFSSARVCQALAWLLDDFVLPLVQSCSMYLDAKLLVKYMDVR